MPHYKGKQSKTFEGTFSDLYIAINETPGYPDVSTVDSPDSIWFQSDDQLNAAFSVRDAKAIVEHINSLIAEIESRTPKPSEIVAAMEPGTKFTFSIEGTSEPAEWFRTTRGAVSRSGVAFANDELSWFNRGPSSKIVEVN